MLYFLKGEGDPGYRASHTCFFLSILGGLVMEGVVVVAVIVA